jgi:hypothetical protein
MRCMLLVVVAVGACAAEEELPTTYGEGLGTPENPVPQDSVPYAVHTQTSSPSSTTQAEVTRIAGSLRTFSQTPAKSLLTLAKTASPEELATLDALSSSLRSRLEGWIDTEIDKVVVDGMRGRAVAAEMADFVDATLAHFSLESTLSFTPTKTTHTLGAISFRLSGLDVVVPVGGLAGDDAQQKPPVSVGAGGSLTFGDHSFGVDFGQHAWHGINLASTTLHGTGVAGALSAAVNCKALAQAVSLKCYNGACVGHSAELSSLCENGVKALAHSLELDMSSVDLVEIHFTSGTARLVDENGDGLANRIEAGAWTPDGLGLASANFTAIAPGR